MSMQSEEELKLIELYKSAPGVGDTTALTLKDELYDMKHFANERQLFSYLGLTPSEFSSGEKVRKGHISRQGRATLRHILIEAAWTAIQKDPGLQKIYSRIAYTRGGRRAIVGIARRLAGRLRSCLINGTPYVLTPA